MEGKSCIFKQLGGVNVVPICIQEKDPKVSSKNKDILAGTQNCKVKKY
jgi:malic enzyme